MLPFNHKERKSVLEKDGQFWDRLVKGLLIAGLAILLFAVILNWLAFV